MAELIANFSGAGKTIPGIPLRYETIPQEIGPCGNPHGPTRRAVYADESQMVVLSDLFREKVLEKPKWAWYVDYFTVDPARYGVHYLSIDPLIRWTNENIDERDPFNLADSMWSPDDVAMWFTHGHEDESTTDYEHVVKFHSEGHAHRLHIAKFNVTLDDEDRWDAYCEFGIRGALGSFGELRSFNRLDAIKVYRV